MIGKFLDWAIAKLEKRLGEKNPMALKTFKVQQHNRDTIASDWDTDEEYQKLKEMWKEINHD